MSTVDMSGATGTYTLYLFMLLMLVMGTVNMVMLKFQHMQKVPLVADGSPEPFDHAWLQAGLMMWGEVLCLPVYLLTRAKEEAEAAQKVPKWIFVIPCCCDLVATALLCAGLAFVAVSVAQMCRGTIVVFVCAMSVVFLGRRQHGYHIAGVSLVAFGILLVAASALANSKATSSSHMGFGIALCIVAQVFQASMFVYEERIMSQYSVQPLQVVGMEGAFGIAISAVILLVGHFAGYANPLGAFHQIAHSPALAISIIGSMLAVAVFNFSGANVTKRSSAVARTTIKMSSTISIWLVELAVGWNTFSYVQLSGFAFVAAGTLLYNRIVVLHALEPSAETVALKSAA